MEHTTELLIQYYWPPSEDEFEAKKDGNFLKHTRKVEFTLVHFSVIANRNRMKTSCE